MKCLYKILVLTAIIVLPLSCDDMFDRETPPHELSGDNTITDQQSAETALNGVYSYFQSYGGPFDAYYISDNEFRAGMIKGIYRGAFDEDQNVEFKVTYESSYLSSPWYRAYYFINAANNFLYYIDKANDSKFAPGKKEEMMAEAKFVRAFIHSYLLKRHGYFWDIGSKYGALIRLDPSSLSNNALARATVAQSYQAILDDYDYVIDHGPAHYSVYRGCAVAAKAFKAEMLMNRGADGDYADAIKLADEVISSTEFGLEDKYSDIFAKGYSSQELLFSKYNKEPERMIGMNTGTMIKMFTEGTYEPTDAYLEIFTPKDKRFDVCLELRSFTVGSNTTEKYMWPKHEVANADCPMYYMRVAQMYLIKAEAMLYTGSSNSQIVEVLNVLRNRSGNTPLVASDYLTKFEMQDEIFKENVREIGTENDALYFILVRMKNADGKRMLSLYNEHYTKESQLCYLIPKDEMQYNPAMEQNPE